MDGMISNMLSGMREVDSDWLEGLRVDMWCRISVSLFLSGTAIWMSAAANSMITVEHEGVHLSLTGVKLRRHAP